MRLEFKNWFENVEAKRAGIKGTILDFLKDKLNISDDDEIMSMQLGSIDQKVIGELLSRGMIQSAPDDVLQDIKNGTITVSDMIDRLAGGEEQPQLMLPYHKNSQHSFSGSQNSQASV